MSEYAFRSSDVNPRYALNNGVIERDLVVAGSQREVLYSAGSAEQDLTRRSLVMGGVILGRELTDLAQGHIGYRIPQGARPLSFEGNVVSGGMFGYSDRDLMYDLGELTGRISSLTNGAVVRNLGNGAENAFVLIDFVEMNEAHLYAAPGVERLMAPTDGTIDRVDVQLSQFSAEFIERYAEHIDSFTQAYRTVA